MPFMAREHVATSESAAVAELPCTYRPCEVRSFSPGVCRHSRRTGKNGWKQWPSIKTSHRKANIYDTLNAGISFAALKYICISNIKTNIYRLYWIFADTHMTAAACTPAARSRATHILLSSWRGDHIVSLMFSIVRPLRSLKRNAYSYVTRNSAIVNSGYRKQL